MIFHEEGNISIYLHHLRHNPRVHCIQLVLLYNTLPRTSLTPSVNITSSNALGVNDVRLSVVFTIENVVINSIVEIPEEFPNSYRFGLK